MPTTQMAISVEDAIGRFARIAPVTPKCVLLQEAIGHRAAEDVIARRPSPGDMVAAMDGWAVHAAQTDGASRANARRLVFPPQPLDAAQALPQGYDAVLPFGSVAVRKRGHYAVQKADPGQGVLVQGSDAHAGAVLIPCGSKITFAAALAAAICGVNHVAIRRPVVDLVLNSPKRFPNDSQMLRIASSAIRASGCEIGGMHFAGGDPASLGRALTDSAADMICTIGGTGSGPGDTTMATIRELGDVVFHGVRLKPGGTCGFGFVGGKPVFACPGDMQDMLAVNIVFSWAFARRLFGRPPVSPRLPVARLASGLPAARHASVLYLARLTGGEIAPVLAPRLTPLEIASSNAAIFVQEGSRHRRKGESIAYLRLSAAM